MFSKISILSLILIFLANKCKSDLEENDLADKPLQEGRTRRMIWLDKKRRLILPPDTSLSVTPMLAFPLVKESAKWISFENFQLQWTFFILFQGLGWTSSDNAWPVDISFLVPGSGSSEANTTNTKRRRNDLDICYVSSKHHSNRFNKNIKNCKENVPLPVMALPPTDAMPGGERATLIPRMEAFLNTFGINGRACLQRAVCEVHEIPLKYGFGLVGEFITMLLSISQSTYASSHLSGYLKAEKAGKVFGDCSQFNRKCSYSIFTSK